MAKVRIGREIDSYVKNTMMSAKDIVWEIDPYVSNTMMFPEDTRDYLTGLIGKYLSTDKIDVFVKGIFAALILGDQANQVSAKIATVIDTLIDIIEQSSQRFRGLVAIMEQVLLYQYPRVSVPSSSSFAMIPGQPVSTYYGHMGMSTYALQQDCSYTEAHLKKLSSALVLGAHSLSISTMYKIPLDRRPFVAELTRHSAIRLIMVPEKDGILVDRLVIIASRQRLFCGNEVCIRGIYLAPCQIRDPSFKYRRDLIGRPPRWRNRHGDMTPDLTAEFVTIECGTDLMDAVSIQLPTAIQGALDQMGVLPRAKSARSAMV